MLQTVAFIIYNIIILYLLNRYCVDLFCPCRIGKEGVTPHPDAHHVIPHSMRDPVWGKAMAFICEYPPAGIHGFRIKCGMTEPSQRGMTRTAGASEGSVSPRTRCGVQSGRQRKGQSPCRYSWIPHQVRNDRTIAARNDRTPKNQMGCFEGIGTAHFVMS